MAGMKIKPATTENAPLNALWGADMPITRKKIEKAIRESRSEDARQLGEIILDAVFDNCSYESAEEMTEKLFVSEFTYHMAELEERQMPEGMPRKSPLLKLWERLQEAERRERRKQAWARYRNGEM